MILPMILSELSLMAEPSIIYLPAPKPDQSGLYIGLGEEMARHTQLDPTGRGPGAKGGMKNSHMARMTILVPAGDRMPAGTVPQIPEATEAIMVGKGLVKVGHLLSR